MAARRGRGMGVLPHIPAPGWHSSGTRRSGGIRVRMFSPNNGSSLATRFLTYLK